MKFAILLVCMLTLSAYAGAIENQLKVSDNIVTESFETFSGFLVGAFGSYTKIESCFDESVDIFKHFRSAFSELKHLDHKGVESGLKDIGLALTEVPTAIKDCEDIKNIMTKVQGLATLFANPSMLVVKAGKNIIWHSRDIFKEVKAAIKAHDNDQYFEMGRQIGKIANDVFLRLNSLQNHGVDFFEGLLHGIDATYFDEAKECIDDISEETYSKISADLKDLSWKNIERSVHDVEDIVSILKGVVSDCETASKDFKAFLTRLVDAIKKTNFSQEALAIMKHPLKFYRMVEHIKKDLDKDDFFDAGDILGDFAAQVLHLN